MIRKRLFLLGTCLIGFLAWLLTPTEKKEKLKKAFANRMQQASLEAAKSLFKRALKSIIRTYFS
ncbi:MAG TPA: hypothetical protein VK133_03105 [Amoebophilaceae bacterium]|jgi:hypothetical protein|nr:hypothetical protein [Amoebophilaceae bacterium]